MSAPKKVVLAYSGGLDTSIILKWLQTEYGCEVVTFTADLGQGEELEPARQKAELWVLRLKISISKMCAKNLCAISCFQCFGPMRFMKACTFWNVNCAPSDFQTPCRNCS